MWSRPGAKPEFVPARESIEPRSFLPARQFWCRIVADGLSLSCRAREAPSGVSSDRGGIVSRQERQKPARAVSLPLGPNHAAGRQSKLKNQKSIPLACPSYASGSTAPPATTTDPWLSSCARGIGSDRRSALFHLRAGQLLALPKRQRLRTTICSWTPDFVAGAYCCVTFQPFRLSRSTTPSLPTR